MKKQAFTLVELIVVITIIAILGTIAFISLQGYSKSARDSTRISDLSTMKTSLELFHLDAGKYPKATNSFDVIYSGSVIWEQGEFGSSTFKNVSRLDKLPIDPLTGKKYTYSVTKNNNEYQLGGIMETDEIVGVLNQVNAAETEARAIVEGNYNGVMFKTSTGTSCEVLTIPSIITNQEESDLLNILNSDGLVYNGKKNLPSNYIGTKYKTDAGFGFTTKKLVAYSDNDNCKALYDSKDSSARIQLINGLQEAYSGTIVENEGVIANIINISETEKEELAGTIINNNLGGKIVKNSNSEKNNPENLNIFKKKKIKSIVFSTQGHSGQTATQINIYNNSMDLVGSGNGINGAGLTNEIILDTPSYLGGISVIYDGTSARYTLCIGIYEIIFEDGTKISILDNSSLSHTGADTLVNFVDTTYNSSYVTVQGFDFIGGISTTSNENILTSNEILDKIIRRYHHTPNYIAGINLINTENYIPTESILKTKKVSSFTFSVQLHSEQKYLNISFFDKNNNLVGSGTGIYQSSGTKTINLDTPSYLGGITFTYDGNTHPETLNIGIYEITFEDNTKITTSNDGSIHNSVDTMAHFTHNTSIIDPFYSYFVRGGISTSSSPLFISVEHLSTLINNRKNAHGGINGF